MKMTIDRKELVAILERFWGTSNVHRIHGMSVAQDEFPMAQVKSLDIQAVQEAVVDLIGENRCERVEIDPTGATVYFRDRDPEHIPFADAADDVA